MKKWMTLSLLAFLGACGLYAQEAIDLLRMSTTDVYGTARSMSMANAFGALGGDATAVNINPAGLGIYRSSEVSYSQWFSNTVTNTDFNGTMGNGRHTRFAPSSFSLVESYLSDDEATLANYNIGVTYNRLNSFYRNANLAGKNRPISILDDIIGFHQDGTPSVLTEMAYQDYLLDKDYNPIIKEGEKVNNSQSVVESGKVDVWDFSFAFNYGYYLYLGASVGIQTLRYQMDTYYSEQFGDGGSMGLRNNWLTKGSGINMKFGAIVRPIPALRIGVAYHTPTWYDMVDAGDAKMTSKGVIDDEGNVTNLNTAAIDPSIYYYQMKTPGSWVYSLAFQLGQKGFLSMDLQSTDYTRLRERDDYGYLYTGVVEDANRYFTRSYQFRSGLEWRITPSWSARVGYAHTTSPISADVEGKDMKVVTTSTAPYYNLDMGTNYFAGGVGYHYGNFFLDLAYLRQENSSHFYPFYHDSSVKGDKYHNYASMETSRDNFVATVGFRF